MDDTAVRTREAGSLTTLSAHNHFPLQSRPDAAVRAWVVEATPVAVAIQEADAVGREDRGTDSEQAAFVSPVQQPRAEQGERVAFSAPNSPGPPGAFIRNSYGSRTTCQLAGAAAGRHRHPTAADKTPVLPGGAGPRPGAGRREHARELRRSVDYRLQAARHVPDRYFGSTGDQDALALYRRPHPHTKAKERLSDLTGGANGHDGFTFPVDCGEQISLPRLQTERFAGVRPVRGPVVFAQPRRGTGPATRAGLTRREVGREEVASS